MLSFEQVQELLKAGFTHDEIMLFTSEQKEPEQKEPEQKEPKQKVPEQKEPEQKNDTPSISNDLVSQFTKAVDNLTKTIQASNLQNAFQESVGKNVEDTAVTALSSIITKSKGEK